ncbi:MAG TPA: hypothetical protein VKE74_21995, partial [Gemmataceae bacterium]|nr:hypothetical protein [Gemmataceae bacterium]
SDPPAPVETADHGYEYAPPPPVRSPRPPAPARPNPVFLLVPTLLAGMAFLMALGTLTYVLIRGSGKADTAEGRSDPLGSGLAAYDFSTPAKALESEAKMEAKLDIRARLELERKLRGNRAQEKLDTLKVHREEDYQGKKILFISYKEKGEMRYRTEAFEKSDDDGLWVPKDISPGEVGRDNPALADQMRRWASGGEKSGGGWMK